jgi:hypothetical protein
MSRAGKLTQSSLPRGDSARSQPAASKRARLHSRAARCATCAITIAFKTNRPTFGVGVELPLPARLLAERPTLGLAGLAGLEEIDDRLELGFLIRPFRTAGQGVRPALAHHAWRRPRPCRAALRRRARRQHGRLWADCVTVIRPGSVSRLAGRAPPAWSWRCALPPRSA